MSYSKRFAKQTIRFPKTDNNKMLYLLDTNIISNLMRPAVDFDLARSVQENTGECAIPSPVWHELLFGVYRLPESKRRASFERFLFDFLMTRFPIVDYDKKAAERHAEERARLTKSGKTPSYINGQIAAIGLELDMTVITRNTKDFTIFNGLRVSRW